MKVRLTLDQIESVKSLFCSNNTNSKNDKTLFALSNGSRKRPKVLEAQYNPFRPAEAIYVTLKIIFKDNKQIWYLNDTDSAELPTEFRLVETESEFKLHMNGRFFIFEKEFISEANQANIRSLFEKYN